MRLHVRGKKKMNEESRISRTNGERKCGGQISVVAVGTKKEDNPSRGGDAWTRRGTDERLPDEPRRVGKLFRPERPATRIRKGGKGEGRP